MTDLVVTQRQLYMRESRLSALVYERDDLLLGHTTNVLFVMPHQLAIDMRCTLDERDTEWLLTINTMRENRHGPCPKLSNKLSLVERLGE